MRTVAGREVLLVPKAVRGMRASGLSEANRRRVGRDAVRRDSRKPLELKLQEHVFIDGI